ncbi:MAG: M23 family metallopeptidase [Saprospiraceae bacterium]|nr:M23 family metallopeptidase [Saprospiraceae bacterium]
MANREKQAESRWERWKKPFRIVVLDPDALKEKNSFETNWISLASLGALGLMVGIFLFSLIVIFSPLRRLIPGYGDVREHPELLRLNKDIEVLKEELASHQAYTDNFRRILVGDIPQQELEADGTVKEFPDSLINVERIREDELLRQEIAIDQRIRQGQDSDQLGGNGAPLSPEQVFFVPPVKGVPTADFDPSKKHFGTDISAPKNTPVLAVAGGHVFMADWTLETGYTLGIQHDNQIISFYKHNSALLKKSGERVKPGEAIAIIGNTGTLSTGPHLHFELWHKGNPLNPSNYIVFQ